MNKTLNIIPTPQFCCYTKGNKLTVSKVCIVGTADEILLHALEAFAEISKVNHTKCEEADLVIYADYSQVPSAYLDADDLKMFDEKFAKKQGYILKSLPNGQLAIIAQNQQGCAYGVMTLRQIVGLDVSALVIRDFPDFYIRGIKWLIWAETDGFSFDFGDGIEAMERRMKRNIDQLFKYKINNVFSEGFGYSADRYEGYAELIRSVCDYARKRGILITCGGYSMSYGMTAYKDSYQGKDFYNRKSYPDGEIYECLGTYVPGKYPYEWRTLNHGTCLSNDALTELKIQEIEEYVRRTHITALSMHNMDAYDIEPGLWETRCEECKKRWPNPSLFARDGMAGAFAEFIDKIIDRLRMIKDGDYDASRDLTIRMAAPGYMYYNSTNDHDYDVGIKFWAAVTQFIKNKDVFIVGLREEQFYWDKPVHRTETMLKAGFEAMVGVGNFVGADGFYDDRLFSTNAAFNYGMKGFDVMTLFNGHAFQEPLQVYNSEYLWNSENSGFFNISPRPTNYQEYEDLFQKMVRSEYKPEEVFGEGGFIDIICQKLYGDDLGLELAKLYKMSGKNGEPPIPFAANVDIFTQYSRAVLPMRWENEMKPEDILAKYERFYQCALMSHKAKALLTRILERNDLSDGLRETLTCFCECFHMGSMLCDLLTRYMEIYRVLDDSLANNLDTKHIAQRILDLKVPISAFQKYVEEMDVKPVDKFEGIYIRRKEMADFLDYNTTIMLYSIEQNKRIPEGVRDALKYEWY